ncbi:hypothetical protein ACHAWF_018123 [Thalassiosira exigua]
MRRFPCCCTGCLNKLAEPIETRCSGASDKYMYWEFFKKPDGLTGYNDWKLVEIVPKPKGYMEEDVLEWKAVTIRGVGRMMSDQVRVGGYGAYPVNDNRYDYYLVSWAGEPWEVDSDETIVLDGESFYAEKGELVCKGTWLERVPGSQRWWYETPQQCIVRMQTVVDSDLELAPISNLTPLPATMRRHQKQFALDRNAVHILEEDHNMLIKEALRRGAFDRITEFEVPVESIDHEDEDESDVDDI